MDTENSKQGRLQLLIHSFFKEHSSDELVALLYTLYRGWALQVSLKVDREERLRVLTGYTDLKEFLEQLPELYKADTSVIPPGDSL